MCSPQAVNINPGGLKFPQGGTGILYYVYQCLFSPTVSSKVTSAILEMTLDFLGDQSAVDSEVSPMVNLEMTFSFQSVGCVQRCSLY